MTHDQTEAMTLGDLVAVMRKGVLQQVATPEELYAHPVNLFVGGFIGSPAMNLVEAVLSEGPGATFVEFAGHRLMVPDEVVAARPGLAAFRGRTVILGIRPEGMEDAALVPSSEPDNRFPVVVDLREGMGSDVYLHFSLDAPPVVTEDTRELASDIDEKALAGSEGAGERAIARSSSPGPSPETTAQIGSASGDRTSIPASSTSSIRIPGGRSSATGASLPSAPPALQTG